jgi:hypothetical protein
MLLANENPLHNDKADIQQLGEDFVSPRKQSYSQTELTKTLKAAAKSGFQVKSIEHRPDGFTLHFDAREPGNVPSPEDASDLI